MQDRIKDQNGEPMVSVIMPCHNDGRYILEAVQSVQNQTYGNIELIVIDDGSDDPETIRAIEDIAFCPKRILHTDHAGPAVARNCGIAAAEGEFILPLDADDLIEPEYIAKAVEVLVNHPETGIVYCHADLFGELRGPWELPDYTFEMELLDNCIFVTSLFRKADWEAAGGYCEEFRAGMEDYDLWLSLLEMGKDVYQFPEVMFHYRIKPSSRSSQFQNQYNDVQNTYKLLYQRHKKLYQEHMDEYCGILRWHLIDQIQLRKKEAEHLNDPMIRYLMSIRAMKPKTARFLDRMLARKDRIKKKIGRE